MCTLMLGTIMLAGTAQAGALRDLAEANNALYRELRDMGTARTSDKIAAQNKHFNPALNALSREHGELYLSWKKAIKANSETKEWFLKIMGRDPITGKNKDGSSPADAKGPVAPPIAVAPKGRTVEADTVQGGADGAKEAKFGGKRKEVKPVTDDSGIIQER